MTGRSILFAASLLLCCWSCRVVAQYGWVTIPGEITFQLDTDPATDPPVFTLTCTSTGGPATNVSWRRDGILLSDDSTYSITSQILINSDTATYNHTLTVTGRLLGVYQCSVPRSWSWSATRSLAVGAGSPGNLNVVQVDPTSFRVSWTPVVTAVGYWVYWSVGGQYDSGNIISVGAGDTAVTITDRIPGLTYNVTIVALSDLLPSPVAVVMITLGYSRCWLRGTTYQNNSLVTLEDIGEGGLGLYCIAVCYGSGIRNWFFPNGTRVPSKIVGWDFYHIYSSIYRRRGGVNGIYRFEMPDAMNVAQTIYIGVYTASTGQVTIPGEITFQLNTDPATDPPVFTLTCTSTGGPVTTVSWRRDGTLLSNDNTYSITSQVTDTETATYTHTLTVTGRLVGEYQCSVSNIRTPSGSSRSLTVIAAGSPSNLNAIQIDPTSFRISWSPPATVTGYQVYWIGGGGADSGNMSVGTVDRIVTITGRTPGLTYDITIVALSDHLPSPAVAVIVYTLSNIRFSLRGITYQNNSLVNLEDIDEGRDALLCVTDLTACCRHYEMRSGCRVVLGNWYFPNGTRVSSIGLQWNMYRTTGWMVKGLHRRKGGVDGIYRCLIPDKAGANQNIYIGVYSAKTGQVTIPDEITFQLDTDPATDPPVFTLTCNSTGGPPTTVSWRRDGTMLSDNNNNYISSQLINSVTATYTNTLTVTGRLAGHYQCSVSNVRTPSGSTQSLVVVAAGLPTNLNAVQVNLTSFRVSWTPPATVTGYQVYWSGGGGYDHGNMSAGTEDTAVTITDRIPGLTYNITLVVLSDHLPIPAMGAVMVTLVTQCPQVMGSGFSAGAVVGACVGTALLYTMILLVSICVMFLCNKRHRKTAAGKEGTHRTPLDTAVVMKECSAYGKVAAHSGRMEDIYENPQ